MNYLEEIYTVKKGNDRNLISTGKPMLEEEKY